MADTTNPYWDEMQALFGPNGIGVPTTQNPFESITSAGELVAGTGQGTVGLVNIGDAGAFGSYLVADSVNGGLVEMRWGGITLISLGAEGVPDDTAFPTAGDGAQYVPDGNDVVLAVAPSGTIMVRQPGGAWNLAFATSPVVFGGSL